MILLNFQTYMIKLTLPAYIYIKKDLLLNPSKIERNSPDLLYRLHELLRYNWPKPPAIPVFNKKSIKALQYCGEGGIRTLGTLLGYTRFPGVPVKPLLHLSGNFLKRTCLF